MLRTPGAAENATAITARCSVLTGRNSYSFSISRRERQSGRANQVHAHADVPFALSGQRNYSPITVGNDGVARHVRPARYQRKPPSAADSLDVSNLLPEQDSETTTSLKGGSDPNIAPTREEVKPGVTPEDRARRSARSISRTW